MWTTRFTNGHVGVSLAFPSVSVGTVNAAAVLANKMSVKRYGDAGSEAVLHMKSASRHCLNHVVVHDIKPGKALPTEQTTYCSRTAPQPHWTTHFHFHPPQSSSVLPEQHPAEGQARC